MFSLRKAIMSQSSGYIPCSYAPFFQRRDDHADREFIKFKREKLLETLGPVRPIRSDYLSSVRYYYNDKTDTIYGICSVSGELSSMSQEENRHLRELNSL